MVVWWRKLAGQRKQTPHKTRPPRGRQGAGAKRKLVQLQKDAAASEQCEHFCKKHAGECWYKPGSEKRNKAEKKAGCIGCLSLNGTFFGMSESGEASKGR
jgi:hypothetical protein